MLDRERRLKTSKLNADRCVRDLKRDRAELERKEGQLISEVKKLCQKGDVRNARILAGQIAHYRKIGQRNMEASAAIGTRAQLMLSSHRTNRAEMEAIKGIKHANLLENPQTFQARAQKYAYRSEVYQMMEDMMNESMDDIYGEVEEVEEEKSIEYETEVDSTIRQALDPHTTREYRDKIDDQKTRHKLFLTIRRFSPDPIDSIRFPASFGVVYGSNGGSRPQRSDTSTTLPSPPPHIPLPADASFHNLNPPPAATSRESIITNSLSSSAPTRSSSSSGVSLRVPNLDLSVDMIKRMLVKDQFAINQLGLAPTPQSPSSNSQDARRRSLVDTILGSSKPFLLGFIRISEEDGSKEFVPFEFSQPLNRCGLRSGDTIWAFVEDEDQRLFRSAAKKI